MRSDELFRALAGNGASRQIRAIISPGIEAFRRGRRERGKSAPVFLSDGPRNCEVDAKCLLNLMDAFLSGDLDAIELEYVANAIELSPTLSSSGPLVDEILMELSNPEISQNLTRAVVEELSRRLHAA